MAAAALCAGGCNRGEVAEEFMPQYDMSEFQVVNAEGKNNFAGDAEFVAKTATDGDFSLNYRLYEPADYNEDTPIPLLLFLHGAGERGNNNDTQVTTYKGLAQLLSQDSALLDAIIIAPQCSFGNSWVDFEDGPGTAPGTYSVDEVALSQSLSTAHKLIKYYYNLGMVDPDRIYVMGISMGGYGTWDSITRNPDLFAAAVPICGGADTSKAALLTNVPVKTFHGTLDPLISVEGTRAMVQAIKDAGGTKIDYTEYEDGYHDIWNRALSTEGLADWIMSQKRSDGGQS